MRNLFLALLFLAPSVMAGTFGVTSSGPSSATMADWGTNYMHRAHRFTSHMHVAGANDVFTEIWVLADSSTTANACSLFAALCRAHVTSGDSATAGAVIAECDTVYPVYDILTWMRLNAVTDLVLTENDTVTAAWAHTEDLHSYYTGTGRACSQDQDETEAWADSIEFDLTPVTGEWSVFGCINQEGGGAIDQGHVPTSYTGGTSWVTPENITGDEGRADFDDACAIDQSGDQNPLAATGFDFSLPTVQSVDSILVFVQANAITATGTRDEFDIALSKDGTTAIQWIIDQPIVTTSADCGGAEADLSFTFRADTLGTWSGAGINDSLYVMLRDSNKDAYAIRFDGMSVTVYFMPQAEAGAETPRLDWLQAPYGAGKVHDVSDTTRIHNP